ncbi:hypothetical protein GE061_014349 [Apolygus lucorum]|uniref:Uncharacterized protein n=1 Tax=Apolygus lucorum TaxID=248454 RepID=A0A6A4KAQ0_APOLU|nr:hypothetical protein GE061_014349 [Apolygus lucorum]
MNANLRPLIILILGTLYLTTTFAYRQKRLSDTRLAELETQMNLKKIRDEARMHKPGFGLRDPHQIGRKRRAPSGLVGILDGSERGDGGRPGAERSWYPGLERIYRSSAAAYPKYPRDQLDLERLNLAARYQSPSSNDASVANPLVEVIPPSPSLTTKYYLPGDVLFHPECSPSSYKYPCKLAN